MIHHNSIRAFEHLGDLNPRCKEVLEALAHLGKATDRGIQDYLGYEERGQVQPRITDLLQRKIIEEAGDVVCAETGEVVRTTRIKRIYFQRDRFKDYTQLVLNWSKCDRCALFVTRRKTVIGKGNLRAPVFIVGYAPGNAEDISGMPFVGSAGRQLDRRLKQHGFSYARNGNVFIANIACCRPTDGITEGNRPLRKLESDSCLPHLTALLEIVYPQIVVLLGKEVSDLFFKNGATLHFPFMSKGVSFYRTSDPDIYNIEDSRERRVYEQQGDIEWRYIQKGYDTLFEKERDEPMIVWNLPQLTA